jgi:hypothetical protein
MPLHHNDRKGIQVGNGIGSSSNPLTAIFEPPLPLPEYPLGALAAVGACFAGLLFYKRKTSHFLNALKVNNRM